ncbi:hypothetical protein BUALT_Bualt02G0200100 [Buddleja alternifolia]|uniref:Uncharacterized protein n=1 Tax=Buddleja alternifolia TaxID=168488 RepID=A0AAV6Y2X6_9LAMI|nr:hypothetical protein BUALT_Bualt02G0200100 [Buddleja alternifolia]
MAWTYSEISLEDLMKMIRNFVNMLLLASGYQSTGRLAYWDSHNIKKSFLWALFIENVSCCYLMGCFVVSKGLMSLDDYQDSVKELDAALSELKSNPHFPQGLAHLSCNTLSRARDLLLEHLIHTLPLRDSNLKAIITASVEMDFSKREKIDNDCLHAYVEKLTHTLSKGLSLSESRNFSEGSNIASEKHQNWIDCDFSLSTIQQLGRRQLAVAHSSSVVTGLEILWKTLEKSMHDELGNTSSSEPLKHSACLIAEEAPVESIIWNCWRSRSLSYMFDKRTIRLVSGASLIFSAPEGQWVQMFERLNTSAESDDDLSETIELLLLGCSADRWSALIEQLISVSYESTTISRLYQEVFNIPLAKSFNLCLKEGFINPKEKNVVEYLEVLLSSQLDQLWKISPVLAAVAIPSWSQLFKFYVRELESQFRGSSLGTRCCSCIDDGLEHRECGLRLANLMNILGRTFRSSPPLSPARTSPDAARPTPKMYIKGSADWDILNHQSKKVVSGSSLKNTIMRAGG